MQSSSSEEREESKPSDNTDKAPSRPSFDGQYVSFKDIDAQYLIKTSFDDLAKTYGSCSRRQSSVVLHHTKSSLGESSAFKTFGGHTGKWLVIKADLVSFIAR